MWHKVRNIWQNNTKVVENYAFMTILQVLNICFYLLIYPFLIRVLGAESYGMYAYTLAVVTLFITFVSFGFDLPAAKKIAENAENKEVMSRVLSEVTTTKIFLEIISLIIFAALFMVSGKMRNNALLFIISSLWIKPISKSWFFLYFFSIIFY